jgi:threonine/homoserine/homoserine lactone efflux protein
VSAAIVALLCGALLGFLLSVPAAGPLLALVVLAGARGDTRRGLALAVGGAVAESAWALVALWGLARVIESHGSAIPTLRGASAILLIVLAVVLCRSPERAPPEPPARRAGPALLGFLLVALNPGFPLTWASVASALYASGLLPESTRLAVPLALGVLAGIVAWFALVMSLARRIGQRVGERAAAKGSRIVAVLLLLAAAWLAVSAILRFPSGGWR